MKSTAYEIRWEILALFIPYLGNSFVTGVEMNNCNNNMWQADIVLYGVTAFI